MMNRNVDPVSHRGSVFLPIALCVVVAGTALPFVRGADEKPVGDTGGERTRPLAENRPPAADGVTRVPVAVARDRAMLMQQIYATTLDVIHDRYFHTDRAIIPARAMEDVFENLERQNGSKANWISVNLRAMSINHDPKTDFEKKAARALGDGRPEYEAVDGDVYRRATPIPLHEGCVGCHAGFGAKPSNNPKMAGLVISIPVIAEESARP